MDQNLTLYTYCTDNHGKRQPAGDLATAFGEWEKHMTEIPDVDTWQLRNKEIWKLINTFSTSNATMDKTKYVESRQSGDTWVYGKDGVYVEFKKGDTVRYFGAQTAV